MPQGDHHHPLTRRRFLTVSGATAAAALAWQPLAGCASDDAASGPKPTADPAAEAAAASLTADPFTLGVGSGDPLADRVVLWTRLAPEPASGPGSGGLPDADVAVSWELATDAGFTNVVATGTALAPAALAHSVHVDAGAGPEGPLDADTWFHYRFTAGNYTSPVGRTRTAPRSDADVAAMRFAFASCQNYGSGYYTAHAALANEADLDLVVFLGDYIYEGGGSGRVRDVPGGEAEDLAGYRDRYALYRSDPNLQAAHAACPWLVVWDDHEVENNYAADIDQDGQGGDAFLTRRQEAYLAWWEHQAVRMPAPVGPDLEVYRSLPWGELATFWLLDGRQYRSPQACGGSAALGSLPLNEQCPEMLEGDRTMLGAAQEAWLEGGLRSSQATWNVVAQQTVFTATPVRLLGDDELVNNDQWDGYPAARQRLIDVFAEPGVSNPLVVTGDIHASGAGKVLTDFSDPNSGVVAHELVGTSISSSFPEGLATLFNTVAGQLPWVEYVNAIQRGYVTVELTPREATAQWQVVDTVDEPVSAVSTDFTWTIPATTETS